MGGVRPPLPTQPRPEVMGEPEAKRPRLDSGLMSEGEFASYHPGSAAIQVTVPTQDHETWQLKGQTVSVDISVMSTVKEFKEKLGALVGGMPIKSQKIKHGSVFLKDTLTLASYNIGPGSSCYVLLDALTVICRCNARVRSAESWWT